MSEKVCSKCKQVKPFEDFRPHPLGKFGLHSICRECERAHRREYMAKQRAENPEKIKASKRRSYWNNVEVERERAHQRYRNNREYHLEYAATYRETHREQIREWQRKHYEQHRAEILAADKESRKRRRDKVRATLKQYRQTHKTEISQRNRARRRAEKFSNKDYSEKDWRDCLEYWGHRCAVCGRSEGPGLLIVADHWMPLCKGGNTSKANIIPLCHGIDGCNNKKHGKHPFDWLLETYDEIEVLRIINATEKYLNSVWN